MSCKVYCGAPWVCVNIDAEGRVNPCCHTKKYGQFGNIKTQTLDEIWNGDAYVELRKALASGKLKGSGCEDCRSKQYSAYSKKHGRNNVEFKPVEMKHSDAYWRNCSKMMAHMENGDSILKSLPTSFQYSPSHACNIDCVFCAQKPNKKASCGPKGYEALREVMPYLTDIMWIGGEPTIQKEFYDWLEDHKKSGNPGTKVFIITNCVSLPDQVLEMLATFQYCHVSVSLDACSKELYESLRRKAVWEKTYSNLCRLLDLRERHPNFGVQVTFLLQKNNLAHLPAFIDFCSEHYLPMRVDPLYSYPIPMRIDLYPELTEEEHEKNMAILKLSVDRMNALYEKLRNAPDKNKQGIPEFGSIYDSMRRYEDGAEKVFGNTITFSGHHPEIASKLLVAYAGGDAVSYTWVDEHGKYSMKRPPGFVTFAVCGDLSKNQWEPFPLSSELFAQHSDKRIAVWGTGGYFREHIATLPDFEDGNRIPYLIDSDPKKHGSMIAGKTVYGPEKLRDGDVDMVFIASIFKQEIYDTLVKVVPGISIPVY